MEKKKQENRGVLMNPKYFCKITLIVVIFLTIWGCSTEKDRIITLEQKVQLLQEKVAKLEKEIESLKTSQNERKEVSQADRIGDEKQTKDSQEEKNKSGWKKIKEWKGSSTKTTEKFTVGSNWAISWSTKVRSELGWGYFAIEIYSASGDIIDMIGNTTSSESDVSYFHKAGTYYLVINTSQPYGVSVLEYR